jgi:DNA-binding NarL/FixJ family response regulator
MNKISNYETLRKRIRVLDSEVVPTDDLVSRMKLNSVEQLKRHPDELNRTPRKSRIHSFLAHVQNTDTTIGPIFISSNTVKSHILNILKKSVCTNRTQVTLRVLMCHMDEIEFSQPG